MDKQSNPNNGEKLNKFQFILYGGVIPLLLSSVIILILLQITGFNVMEKAKSIPVVASYIEKREKENSIEVYQKRLDNLKVQLQKEQSKVNELEETMAVKDREIERLRSQKEKLEQEIAKATSIENSLNQIVLIYEEMSPETIAAILLEMDENMAVKILQQLKESTVSKVLEKMPANQAARFTAKLAQ